jgi:putative nucleotidyltransferase with HDIG domain
MAKDIRQRGKKYMRNVEQIIEQIDTLRPISPVSSKIMDIARNPDSSLSELVEVIQYDQAMTTNLLRICNSSYFGLTKRIESIRQAVAYLGTEKVASLVIMKSSSENFAKAQQGYDLNEGELWKYSVSSALIAQDLAEQKNVKDVSLIFTSALLKDIGKVILNNYVEDSFEDIIATVQSEGLAFIEAEKKIIGIDHAELGAQVAERWNFSPAMVKIIRNHHSPDKSPPDDLSVPIIYLADSICMMIGIGVGSDGLAYRYDLDVMNRLNFSDIDLQRIIANFWENLKSVEELVNLSAGG